MTAAGTFTAVIFNSEKAKETFDSAFETLKKVFLDSSLYYGIKNVGKTLNQWGTIIISTKDDFRSWLDRYLNPNGLKSGVSELYDKLVSWALIVYDWFANKFLKFIGNIPDMVKNWKQLRLSLFKWGTFLGGGGGSALWSMFGSGDNWGRLAEFMGDPEFADVVDKFSTLLEDNGTAFAEMQQEEAQEIFEKILESPEEAKDIVEDLLEQQKEKNKDQEQNQEQSPEEKKENKKELEKKEIMEAFTSAGGGSPKNPEGVFGNMVSSGLQDLVNFKPSSFGPSAEYAAWDAMNKYIKTIKDEVQKKVRKADIKQKFLDAIKGEELAFTNALAKAAAKAYNNLQSKQPLTYAALAEEFGNVLEKEFTVEAQDDEEGVSIKDQIPKAPLKKTRR